MPHVDWEQLRVALQSWIQQEPWMFASSMGLVLSSAYILLMLVTRLGDVKPGVQTLILSALLHCGLVIFWGSLAITAHIIRPKAPIEIPVRQVVIEGDDEPTETPDGSNPPAWEKLPVSQREESQRREQHTAAAPPVPLPERDPQAQDLPRAEIPKPPQLPDAPLTNPEMNRSVERIARAAVDPQVQIQEETAEARADVATTNAVRSSPTRERPGLPDSTPERQSRQGSNPDVSLAVEESRQLASIDAAVDPKAAIRRGPDMDRVQRRAAPAPADVAIEDPGVANGENAAETGTGAPRAVPFARTSRNQMRGDRTPSPERTLSRGDSPQPEPQSPTLLATRNGSRDFSPDSPRPSVARVGVASIPQRDSAPISDTYRLRNLPRRQKVALSLGATQESERAVESSLKWLALHQSPEGYWDANGFMAHCPNTDRCWGAAGQGEEVFEGPADQGPRDPLARKQAGLEADSGLTALVVLAFLGAGYTQEEGQYADQIDRALRWLVRQQTSDGFLGGKATRYDRMYCHGMATYALGEACGMMADPSSDSQLRGALQRAVQYIIETQNTTDGGWRYLPGQPEGDMSMFGWQLMALKSAEIAGIEIPAETRSKMIQFLKSIASGEHGGLASYRRTERPKPSMTAEALFSKQMLGIKRSNLASREAVDYLLLNLPKQSDQDLYYWYYGTLAMYQYGGEPWREWNDRLRDALVASQRETGHAAGSWDPRDRWGKQGGRLYATALSTLCLEVYYRFLPLYQLGAGPGDKPRP